jgi:succinyl-CoA synthetase beta subunit
MASNDLLNLFGAKPSNFMDLGGQAYHEKVTHALVLMEKDENVDSIFLNMYCG